MPEFAVLIYASESLHSPEATREDLEECDDFAETLVDEGAMTLAFALTPRDLAVTVREGGVQRSAFHGDAEIVAGFYVLDAPDLDAAIAIARRDPAVAAGGGVEIRPVHSGGVTGSG